MMYSYQQLLYVAEYANKKGAKGYQLIAIIPPQNATDGEFDFKFVFDLPPVQSATDKDWRD